MKENMIKAREYLEKLYAKGQVNDLRGTADDVATYFSNSHEEYLNIYFYLLDEFA